MNDVDLKAFDCVDCGVSTHLSEEYYMVHDQVWHAAGMLGGMLCIGCLEKRLGRELKKSDFTDAPVNWGIWSQSDRLLDRLSRVEE